MDFLSKSAAAACSRDAGFDRPSCHAEQCAPVSKVNRTYWYVVEHERANVRMSLAHCLERPRDCQLAIRFHATAEALHMTNSDVNFSHQLRIVGMWVFLGPLIIILGTLDVLTSGRSRAWPPGEKIGNGEHE